MLPPGTAVVFISDGRLDTGARESATAEVHLRDALVLDGVVVAPAGTRARLVAAETTPDGKTAKSFTIARFTIHAGLLPVRPKHPIVPPVEPGTTIEATTQAALDHVGDRFSIRIPFPFKLSADKPASSYTPTPARTPPPRVVRTPTPRNATPTPAPPNPAATKTP